MFFSNLNSATRLKWTKLVATLKAWKAWRQKNFGCGGTDPPIPPGHGPLYEWAQKYPDAFLRACAYVGISPEEVWKPENRWARVAIVRAFRLKISEEDV